MRLMMFSLVIIFLTSCGSMASMINADRNIRKVELGMSRNEVVSIMGKDFRVLGASRTEEGDIETIGYDNANDELYLLDFLEGKLVGYELTRPHQSRPHGKDRPRHD